MSRSDGRGEHGFTLIEVLAAVLIVCLVFGLLLESVTHNLRDLSRAREEARAAEIAEDQTDELEVVLASGEKLEDGVREEHCSGEGVGEMICQTIVRPRSSRSADYPGEASPSPLFTAANEPPRAPQPGQPHSRRSAWCRCAPIRLRPTRTRSSRSSCWSSRRSTPRRSRQLQQEAAKGSGRRRASRTAPSAAESPQSRGVRGTGNRGQRGG